MTSAPVVLGIAVETPRYTAVGGLLDYTHTHALPLGTLVRAPLGHREVAGIVWQAAGEGHLPPAELRPVTAALDALPPLSESWRALIDFAAAYYQRGVGELALAVLPPELRKIDNTRLARRINRLQRDAPASAGAAPKLPDLNAEQASALAALEQMALAGTATPGTGSGKAPSGPPPVLLHGVTGSGKTEVYLRAADAALQRGGHPNFGPLFDYNESKNAFYGVQIGGPIPVFNQKRGEILQARATFAQAIASVRQFEVQSAQDVQAALARLAAAQKWADRYSAVVLPNLLRAMKDMNKLLEQNEPGVDVLKVIGVQRNYLTAFSAYLDAQYEVSQARADLAAAVGDPALAVGLYAPSPPAGSLPAPKPPAPAKDKP